MQDFKTIEFPITSQYSSDSENIPLEFYEAAIPKSKTIDMVLGYFSTNAIKTLCLGFSEFIYLGGRLRIVTNHQLTEDDKRNLVSDTQINNENKVIDIFQDLELLKMELGPFGQHFFDCLKYLLKNDRLVILPVMHKPEAMAHYKKIILFDGNNYLYASGSANFTSAGIIRNGESFIVDKSWGSETEQQRIEAEKINFNLIFDKKHPSFDYIDEDKIITVVKNIGNNLTELELLENAFEKTSHFSHSEKIKKIISKRTIEFQNLVDETRNKPRFPFPIERDIQINAYNAWVKNGKQGIFAMATGSGKTVTALNCVLKEFSEEGYYKTIIVVPTQTLALQWEQEVRSFNFQNVVSTHTDKDWKTTINRYTTRSILDQDKNLILITTYSTFNRKHIQTFLKDTKGISSFIYVADEAHNVGAANTEKYLPANIARRIGLSATPDRIYDEAGSESLYRFFNSRPPEYTFKYTMKQAIDDEILCHYDYFPCFVELTTYEMQRYKELTIKLTKFIDSKTGKYKKEAEKLLLERKRVVHKAQNKKTIITNLLDSFKQQKKLDYTFVFVPEGYEPDYAKIDNYTIEEEDIHIIDEYADLFKERGYSYYKYLGGLADAQSILSSFAKGDIQILLSMKCLDEGVDIPRAEHAIFCSSTGNPRQFVQRRGRILRKSEGKVKAKIWDLIVMPAEITSENSSVEKNMFLSEVKRVVNFAALADNQIDILYGDLKNICERLGINLFDMLEQEYNQYIK